MYHRTHTSQTFSVDVIVSLYTCTHIHVSWYVYGQLHNLWDPMQNENLRP